MVIPMYKYMAILHIPARVRLQRYFSILEICVKRPVNGTIIRKRKDTDRHLTDLCLGDLLHSGLLAHDRNKYYCTHAGKKWFKRTEKANRFMKSQDAPIPSRNKTLWQWNIFELFLGLQDGSHCYQFEIILEEERRTDGFFCGPAILAKASRMLFVKWQ